MINSPQYIPQYPVYQQQGMPYNMSQPQQPQMPAQEQSSLSAVARYAQPRYSGVSIEILEPQVKVPAQTQGFYNYPTNSIYAPQAQTNQYVQPAFNYPQPPIMMNPIQQLPPAQPQPVPQSVLPQVAQPQVPQPAPQVIQQPVITYEPQPKEKTIDIQETFPAETTMITEPDVTPIPVAEEINKPQPVLTENIVAEPKPIESNPVGLNTTEHTPNTENTELTIPALELGTAISGLRSENIEEQAKTMENISTTLEKAPEQGLQFIDPNVVNALVDVLNKDTSKMDGPTPRQQVLRQKMMGKEQLTPEETAEANSLSPMEAAERNKQYSLYTIAMIQNAMGNEIEKTGTTLPLSELPAIEHVIKTANDSPNPMLRASALAGLSHIAKPEYSEILGTIFTIASTKDEDAIVKGVAKEALTKLDQIKSIPVDSNTPAVNTAQNLTQEQQNQQTTAA